jgi:hypothetical protein
MDPYPYLYEKTHTNLGVTWTLAIHYLSLINLLAKQCILRGLILSQIDSQIDDLVILMHPFPHQFASKAMYLKRVHFDCPESDGPPN